MSEHVTQDVEFSQEILLNINANLANSIETHLRDAMYSQFDVAVDTFITDNISSHTEALTLIEDYDISVTITKEAKDV